MDKAVLMVLLCPGPPCHQDARTARRQRCLPMSESKVRIPSAVHAVLTWIVLVQLAVSASRPPAILYGEDRAGQHT